MIACRTRLALLLAAAALAGCGNTPYSGTYREAFAMIASSRGKAKPAGPLVTRAELDARGVRAILVEMPKFNERAVLTPIAVNGPVTTSATTEAQQLSLDHGLVTATRGLPQDLMSAELPDPADLARGTGTVAWVAYILNGLNKAHWIAFTCSLSTLGAETTTILDQTYPTRHVAEDCEGSEGIRFTNDYWFGSDGQILRSRQWISPGVGSPILERLTK